MRYNWQQKDWPDFRFDPQKIEALLTQFAIMIGKISGLLTGLSASVRAETLLDMMVAEAIKTSEIEGEHLNQDDVMSSVRHHLGLVSLPKQVKDKRAVGAAELMVNVRETFKNHLSEDVFFQWHAMLMKGSWGVKVGAWRDHGAPMQVISGPIGKEKVHFEAPPSKDVPGEMARFIAWFNDTMPGGVCEIRQPAIRSAIAHLYFESIHPFEDGNGRIGRAIAEKALSQTVGAPMLLSLSHAIEVERKAYYAALKSAQSSNDISDWMVYFITIILRAQTHAGEQIIFTIEKKKFFDRYESKLNDRQLRVVRRMLKNGLNSFEGGMSAKKYSQISGASKATATRDIQDLVLKNIFILSGGGRSTRYQICLNKKTSVNNK